MFEENISKYLAEHGFGMWNPKAVLFDMDGVLYDSMPNHSIAWQQAMARFGIKMTAADAYATEGARGVDTIKMFAEAQLGKVLTPEECQAMYDVKTEIFHTLPTAGIFDGAKELMQQIKAQGMVIGIVTGSGQKPLINRMAEDFKEFVDPAHIVTAYNISRGKPAPDPYLKGLEMAGNLSPWQGIVVENAPLGVRAGVAANIFTIAINSGPLPDDALTNEGANVLFPSMRRLSDAWHDIAANF